MFMPGRNSGGRFGFGFLLDGLATAFWVGAGGREGREGIGGGAEYRGTIALGGGTGT
jgi:hypothetical protein